MAGYDYDDEGSNRSNRGTRTFSKLFTLLQREGNFRFTK